MWHNRQAHCVEILEFSYYFDFMWNKFGELSPSNLQRITIQTTKIVLMAILRLHSPKMISSKIFDTEIVLIFHTVKHTTCKACRMHVCGWCAVVFTSASLHECDVTRVRRYYLTNTSTTHSYYYRNLQLDYCALCVLPKNLPTSNTFFKTFVVALKSPFPKKNCYLEDR